MTRIIISRYVNIYIHMKTKITSFMYVCIMYEDVLILHRLCLRNRCTYVGREFPPLNLEMYICHRNNLYYHCNMSSNLRRLYMYICMYIDVANYATNQRQFIQNEIYLFSKIRVCTYLYIQNFLLL